MKFVNGVSHRRIANPENRRPKELCHVCNEETATPSTIKIMTTIRQARWKVSWPICDIDILKIMWKPYLFHIVLIWKVVGAV